MVTDSYKVGLIRLLTPKAYITEKTNLQATLGCITAGKELGLDLLVGPEWGLMLGQDEDAELSPKDATKFYPANPWRLPYSPREARKIINLLKDATKGSDMIVMPGTMMIYTSALKLYNVMPVFRDGKVIYSVFKNKDGCSTEYNLDGTLKLALQAQGKKRVSSFECAGIKFGVEICADRGLLASSLPSRSLDIQVLSSSGVCYTETLALKETGYVVCADGNTASSNVRTATNWPADARLRIYDELDVYTLPKVKGRYVG
jgi:predicted amidohydrolase